MKLLLLLSLLLFISKAFSQGSKDSTKTLFSFTYNLVPKKDSNILIKKSELLQNDSAIISGKIIDENTDNMVSYATISFTAKKEHIHLSTTSNVNGEFRLAIPYKYLRRKINIKIQSLGFEPKMITFKKKQLPLSYQTIKLKINTILLN